MTQPAHTQTHPGRSLPGNAAPGVPSRRGQGTSVRPDGGGRGDRPRTDQRGRGGGDRSPANDKRTGPDTGERMRFSSAILPPWTRKTPKITEVLPLLYLHRLSSGGFVPALGQFPGSTRGLSRPVITKLTERAFAERDLSDVDYVYLWADGIHVNIRLEEAKLCLPVVIGVRADGRKELVALADGYRESTESWADLLRDCKRRGMRAPVLSVGDGALGFWERWARSSPKHGNSAAGSTEAVKDQLVGVSVSAGFGTGAVARSSVAVR